MVSRANDNSKSGQRGNGGKLCTGDDGGVGCVYDSGCNDSSGCNGGQGRVLGDTEGGESGTSQGCGGLHRGRERIRLLSSSLSLSLRRSSS
jgi:hypothetical protein